MTVLPAVDGAPVRWDLTVRALAARVREARSSGATGDPEQVRALLDEVLDTLGRHPGPAAGAVAARIGSSGRCDRRYPHPAHLDTTGIVDNGGNVVLHSCPGQVTTCANCDDRKCMDCVFRYVHDRCRDSCPDCCARRDVDAAELARLAASPGADRAWGAYHGRCQDPCEPERAAFVAGWARATLQTTTTAAP